MESIQTYIFNITAIALVCGIMISILGKKGLCGNTVKFLCGVAIMLSIVGPPFQLPKFNFINSFREITVETELVTAFGQETAYKEYADIIKNRTAAYILDKAESLGAKLTVEVTLSNEMPMSPCEVKLSGAISPYAKKVLSNTIAKDLGIDVEEQTWIG